MDVTTPPIALKWRTFLFAAPSAGSSCTRCAHSPFAFTCCRYYDNFACGNETLAKSTVTGTTTYRLSLNFCLALQYQLQCPVDCVGAWSDWTLRDGYQWRTYEVTRSALHGGAECECECGSNYTEILEEDCYVDRDCGTNCDEIPNNPNGTRPDNTPCIERFQYIYPCIGAWSQWDDECSVTCDNGTKWRTFEIEQEAKNGGRACNFTDGDLQNKTCYETTEFKCTNYTGQLTNTYSAATAS